MEAWKTTGKGFELTTFLTISFPILPKLIYPFLTPIRRMVEWLEHQAYNHVNHVLVSSILGPGCVFSSWARHFISRCCPAHSIVEMSGNGTNVKMYLPFYLDNIGEVDKGAAWMDGLWLEGNILRATSWPFLTKVGNTALYCTCDKSSFFLSPFYPLNYLCPLFFPRSPLLSPVSHLLLEQVTLR